MSTLPIYFFLPCNDAQFNRLPTSLSAYSEWQTTERELNPYTGRYHWVLQTYLHLLEAGQDARLVRSMPSEGIVLAHIETLAYGQRPTRELLVVPMLVDKNVPLPHAPIHITHNPAQKLPLGMRSRYVPPWPQIGLIPRAADRGDRFERLSFLGYRENLHPGFAGDEFARQLQRLGLELTVPEPAAWHDFSQVDAVLAVRNFGRNNAHLTKPALKLFNAWMAGVPALVGHETACRAVGCPGQDYFETVDQNEVSGALEQLSVDVALRQQMVKAGHVRMQEHDTPSIRARWARLIHDELIPMHERWRTDWLYRAMFTPGNAIRERLLWRRPGWFVERMTKQHRMPQNG